MRPPLVFALPGFASLRIGGDGVETAELAVDRFPNDELRVRLAADVAGRRCALIGSVAPPGDDLVGMLLSTDTLRRHRAASVTAVTTDR